jgi:hypothetical protein
MGRLVIDMRDKTKEEIEKKAKKLNKTLKAFVLEALGIKDDK